MGVAENHVLFEINTASKDQWIRSHCQMCFTAYPILVHVKNDAPATSKSGRRGMLDVAKAMALTAADLLADPEHLQRVCTKLYCI